MKYGIPSERSTTVPELRSTAADMEGSGDVAPTPQSPLSLFGTDPLLGEEERAIRDTVHRFVEEKIRPWVAG
jgi:hypothetical protein